MPKSENQKLKLLYLQKMLLEETDEEHTLTVNAIIERLEIVGIKAERKVFMMILKICKNLAWI